MKRRTVGAEHNVFLSVVWGAAISAVIMLALTLLCSVIVNMMSDPLAATDIASLAVLLVAAAVSGFVISRRAPEKKMLTASLSALLLCLVLIVIGLIVSAGALTGRIFLNYICYMGVSLLCAWLGARDKKRHRRRI